MANQFKIGDRVVDLDGNRADVLAVSKDGKRIRIETWVGEARPKRFRMWTYAASYAPFCRQAA